MNLTVLQVFYAVFSGVIEGFAIASELIPYGSPFLALFCLAPLYIALYKSKSYKECFVIYFLQVLTVHMISSYWLANFHGFAAFTLGASAAGTAFQGGLMGMMAYAYPATVKKDSKLKENSGTDCYSIFKRMLWFSAIWVLFEYEKSVGAMGYPWGTVSMAAYNWKIFTQIADVTGVYGITFIYSIFSCLFAEGLNLITSSGDRKLLSNYRQALLFTVSLFAISGLYGIFQYAIPRTPEKHFNAVLVQQNVDPWETGDGESIAISKKLTDEGIERLAAEGKETDLVVWSEGVLAKNFPGARFYYSRFPEDESLKTFINKKQIPFLIGGMAKINNKKRHYANSAILFDKEGSYSGFYSKIQLVPFAEKIPYYDNPLMTLFMNEVVGFNSTLTSGFQYVLFKIPLKEHLSDMPPLNTGHKLYETIELNEAGLSDISKTELYINGAAANPDGYLNFTTPICFEDAFPTICRNLYNMGSELFLNITNDSWSKTRSSEMQHFIVASYLATEFRTTLVRCANSGYTVVLDPAGKILADLPLFEEGALAYSIPVYERKNTIYAACGDWFVILLALCVMTFILHSLFNIWKPYLVEMKKINQRIINIEEEDDDIAVSVNKGKTVKSKTTSKKKTAVKISSGTKAEKKEKKQETSKKKNAGTKTETKKVSEKKKTAASVKKTEPKKADKKTAATKTKAIAEK
ncbi:apolipoprotein N-acyltransferase [Treponema sp.]|uniref:apolipoprotein N-acyltransferase n=1 Tax=Treponema sp. TaxID=166 RepID=UPI00298DD093|nr:apolipoprotein N-acyltransferase [Treponema sp.]MCQ2240566.1 apolipoprotein N-acyltransferase [Treponema sp.]